MASKFGNRRYLHAAALGKVLLSGMADEQIAQLLRVKGTPPYTEDADQAVGDSGGDPAGERTKIRHGRRGRRAGRHARCVRQGFRDGWIGWLISFVWAYYAFDEYRRTWLLWKSAGKNPQGAD